MPTTTTNYGLLKPLVNDPTDQDLWGNYLNEDQDDIDGLLKTAINWVKSDKTSSFSVTAPTAASAATGDSNKLFRCDATGAAIIATLPTAAAAGDGFAIAFKKTDASANTITITADGSEKIDASSTYVLSARYDWLIIICDGTGWNITSRTSASTAGFLLAANNLSDVVSAATSRTNLGLGSIATLSSSQAAKAWVNFNSTGGTITVNASFNVSSVTRNGVGDYTVNFTTPLADVNYSATLCASSSYGVGNSVCKPFENGSGNEVAPTTSAFRFAVAATNVGQFDPKYVCVTINGT